MAWIKNARLETELTGKRETRFLLNWEGIVNRFTTIDVKNMLSDHHTVQALECRATR